LLFASYFYASACFQLLSAFQAAFSNRVSGKSGKSVTSFFRVSLFMLNFAVKIE